jgi:hypothetical protein
LPAHRDPERWHERLGGTRPPESRLDTTDTGAGRGDAAPRDPGGNDAARNDAAVGQHTAPDGNRTPERGNHSAPGHIDDGARDGALGRAAAGSDGTGADSSRGDHDVPGGNHDEPPAPTSRETTLDHRTGPDEHASSALGDRHGRTAADPVVWRSADGAGLSLTEGQKARADDFLARAHEVETSVNYVMRVVTDEHPGVRLESLGVKTDADAYRDLATGLRRTDATPEQLVADTYDVLRYRAVIDEGNFAASAQGAGKFGVPVLLAMVLMYVKLTPIRTDRPTRG